MLIALLAVAWADAPEADAPPPEREEAPAPVARGPLKWSGFGLPYAGVNSVDGIGFGAGGEIFGRPEGTYGYLVKLTLSTWFTTSFNYNSHYAQLEWRGAWHALGRLGYQGWNNMLYAGEGGADVLVDWGPRELGNGIRAPYAMFALSRPLWREDTRGYAQLYGRYAHSSPAPGSLLDERQPHGAGPTIYGDLTLGFERDTTDRWPLPTDGYRAEIDARLGASGTGLAVPHPLVGAHAELITWTTLGTSRFTVGTRNVVEKSAGLRPYTEQNVTGGRWRDELGFEQPLSGYGRLRTRGDGVVASLVEVRASLFHTRHDFFDVAGYVSVYAEQAWLFDGWDPGPPMPSVGIGPVAVWQGASVFRPFFAWGWRADAPGGDRSPSMQFGISLTDPL